MTSRHYCFTLNNPTPEERNALASLECVYIVYGNEIAPTTGTPHLQGFVIFEHGHRITALKHELGDQSTGKSQEERLNKLHSIARKMET